MGLLDWLSPALNVGTQVLAAQRQGQADTIREQQAAAAAAAKAFLEKRKTEAEIAYKAAQTANEVNQQTNELARIAATGQATTTSQTAVAAAKDRAQGIRDLQGFVTAFPGDPRAVHAMQVIKEQGGDINKAYDVLGAGYTATLGQATAAAKDTADLAQEQLRQSGQNTRTREQIAATATQGDLNRANARWLLEHRPPTGVGGAGGAAIAQAKAMQPEIEQAALALDAITPDLMSRMFSDIPLVGNYLKTEQGRQFEQQARQFITNVVYVKSGKAITDTEFQRLFGVYIPELGDDQGTLAQKARARQLFLAGQFQLTGRGAEAAEILRNYGFNPEGAGGGTSLAPTTTSPAGVHLTPAPAGATGPDPAFRARASALKASGVSAQQIRATLQAEGWDPSTGRRR